MPYGIKGKTKEWEEETKLGRKIDARIKKCVDKLMADPDFEPGGDEDKETAAIKVCKSTITKSDEFKKQLKK
ncbi:MAG: hypothetical protein WCQ69_09460 [Bacteroidales bacterium]|jgi:hypothetical protein|nr:hypothetical protein [Patescibacteria group bacterium]